MTLLFSGVEPFVHFGKGQYEEQLCKIILYLDQWFIKYISYLELWQPPCLG